MLFMKLRKWFRQWQEKRKLRKFALDILADPAPSIDALIKARGIVLALDNRNNVCKHCFEWYVPRERSFADRFQVRAILMIPDREPDPMLCEGCFETIVGTYNPQATNIGTSNSGPRNMALSELR